MVAPAISSAKLDAIGDRLARLRPDTCVITRPPTTESASGAQIGEYEPVITISPEDGGGCRVELAGGQIERIFGGRFASEADYVVFIHRRHAAHVQSRYRIEVNGLTLGIVHDPSAASFEAELAIPCSTRE